MKCDTCGKEIIKDGRREPDFSSYICKECNEKKKQKYEDLVPMPTIKICHQCGLRDKINCKIVGVDKKGMYACEEHRYIKRGDA